MTVIDQDLLPFDDDLGPRLPVPATPPPALAELLQPITAATPALQVRTQAEGIVSGLNALAQEDNRIFGLQAHLLGFIDHYSLYRLIGDEILHRPVTSIEDLASAVGMSRKRAQTAVRFYQRVVLGYLPAIGLDPLTVVTDPGFNEDKATALTQAANRAYSITDQFTEELPEAEVAGNVEYVEAVIAGAPPPPLGAWVEPTRAADMPREAIRLDICDLMMTPDGAFANFDPGRLNLRAVMAGIGHKLDIELTYLGTPITFQQLQDHLKDMMKATARGKGHH